MPRIRRAVPFAVAIAFAVPLAAQGGTATSKRAPQDCLPASSYFAAGFAGLEACSRALTYHDAAKLVVDFVGSVPQQARENLDRHLEQAAEHVRRALAQADLPAATLRAVLQRPMALGVGRMTIRGMGASVALLVDEGDATTQVDALVDWVVHLAQQYVQVNVGKKQVAGADCRTLEFADAPTIVLARTRGLFVVTNSEPYLAEILACERGQPSLAARSTLGVQRKDLGGTPLVEVYSNTAPLLAAFEPFLPYEAAELGDALGVRSLGGVYGGIATVGGGTAEMFDLAVEGSAHGMLKAAFAGPADLAAAEYFGSDTLAFATARFDPVATFAGFDALLGLLPEQAAKQARSEMQRELTREFRHAGITAAQFGELLHAIGGTVSVGLSMAKGAPVPEGLAVLSVRDRKALAPWLEKAFEASAKEGVEWKTRDADGVTIRYCDVPMDGIRLPLAPAIALLDDRLLIGSQPKVIVAALKQREDRAGSLAAVEDFAAQAQRNPNASLLVHLRQGLGVARGWRFVESMFKSFEGVQEQLGFGPEALPDQEDIARAAGTTTFTITVDDHGVRLRTQGNLGLGGLLLGAASLGDAVLQRAANKVY